MKRFLFIWICSFFYSNFYAQATLPAAIYEFDFDGNFQSVSGNYNFSGTYSATSNRMGQPNKAAYITTTNSVYLPLIPQGSANRSIAMWIALDTVPLTTYLFSYGTDLNGQGVACKQLSNNLYAELGSPSLLSLNYKNFNKLWFHYVFVYDNGQVKIFVNGKPESQTIVSLNTNGTVLQLHSPIVTNPSVSANYKIDELKIYNSALTPAQIDLLYYGPTHNNQLVPNLVAYYGFNSNANSHNNQHNFASVAGVPTPSYTPARVGQGIRMNATPMVNTSSLFSALGNTEFSICFWEQSMSNPLSGKYPTVFEMYESAFLRHNGTANGGTYEYGYASGSSWYTQLKKISINRLRHFAIVHKAGNAQNFDLYIDGIYHGSVILGGIAASVSIPNSLFYLGGGSSSGSYNAIKNYDGIIDEMHLYNKALTQSEVIQVMNYVPGTSGLQEKDQETRLILYPNPATNLLNVNTDGKADQIDIYSVTGQKCVATRNNPVDISGLEKGVYFITVTNVFGQFRKGKFVKN